MPPADGGFGFLFFLFRRFFLADGFRGEFERLGELGQAAGADGEGVGFQGVDVDGVGLPVGGVVGGRDAAAS